MISPTDAKNRAVVQLEDGRTARLWYVPPDGPHHQPRRRHAVSRGRCVVKLPSGNLLTVRRDSVTLVEEVDA